MKTNAPPAVPPADILEAIDEACRRMMQNTQCEPGMIFLGGLAMRAFDDHPRVRDFRRYSISEPPDIRAPKTWRGMPMFEVLDSPLLVHVSPMQRT